jgi:hypothetical protein
MVLQKGRIGIFYSCSKWLSDGCQGKINADNLGNPIKGDEKSRILRVKAELIMENLWRNNFLPQKTRNKIFEDLCRFLKINKCDFDINQFSMTRCKTVVAFVNQRVKNVGKKTPKKSQDSFKCVGYESLGGKLRKPKLRDSV